MVHCDELVCTYMYVGEEAACLLALQKKASLGIPTIQPPSNRPIGIHTPMYTGAAKCTCSSRNTQLMLLHTIIPTCVRTD